MTTRHTPTRPQPPPLSAAVVRARTQHLLTDLRRRRRAPCAMRRRRRRRRLSRDRRPTWSDCDDDDDIATRRRRNHRTGALLPRRPSLAARSPTDRVPCAAPCRNVAMRRAPCAVRRFEPTTAPVRARAVTTVQNAGPDPGRSRITSRPRTHVEGSAMTCCWGVSTMVHRCLPTKTVAMVQGSDDNSTHSDKRVFQGTIVVMK